MGVLGSTSPSAVVYKRLLYVFFVGNGFNGIFYTASQGQHWQQAAQVDAANLGIQNGTSPDAALIGGVPALFFNGSGGDGIWFTVSTPDADGALSTWTTVDSIHDGGATNMSVASGTSPSALVVNDTPYVFFVGASDSGIWYTRRQNSSPWSQAIPLQAGGEAVFVLGNSNPSAVFFGNTMYVFYSGAGGDGIYLMTSPDAGKTWTPVERLNDTNNIRQGQTPGSPAAGVVNNGGTLLLVWPATAGNLFYKTFDGSVWAPAQSMFPGGINVDPTTGGAAVADLDGTPCVFWCSDEGANPTVITVWFSTGSTE